MLVLSRKPGEVIMIGQDIQVVVVEVTATRVRLGVVAPPATPVHRSEVFDRIHHLAGPPPRPFAGWTVVYSTPAPEHLFSQRFRDEMTGRYPGVCVILERHPSNHIEVIPPPGTDLATSGRIGDEVEALLLSLHERMRRDRGG